MRHALCALRGLAGPSEQRPIHPHAASEIVTHRPGSTPRWRLAPPVAQGHRVPQADGSRGTNVGMSQNSATREPQVLVHISIFQGSILGTNF